MNTRGFGSWSIFRFLVFILLLSIGNGALSQVHGFKHYGLDKNIFPSRIECLDQASTGELLIGTLAGLVIYDGFGFQTMGVSDGLAESSISSIYVEGNDIWLGHWTGNLTKYDIVNDTFQAFALSDQLNFSTITKMSSLPDGDLFILTREGNVFIFSEEGVERVVLPNADGEPVLDLFVQEAEVFVVLPSQILHRSLLRDSSTTWKVIFNSGNSTLKFAHPWQEDVWFLGFEDKVRIVSLNDDKERLSDLTSRIESVNITAVDKDIYGNFWLSTELNGVIVIDIVEHCVKRLGRNNGLSYNQVRCLMIDREGIVWIATSAGLDQYLGDAFVLHDERSGIPGSIIWDICSIKDNLYIASSTGLTVAKAPSTISNLERQYDIDLDGNEPMQVLFDGYDRVWVLDQLGQVWMLNHGAMEAEQITSLDFQVNCFELVDGRLWLGTNNGVYVLSNHNNKPVEHLTAQTGLAGNRITGIFYSKIKNETWIAALGSETTRYKDAKFKRFGVNEGLTSTVIQDADFDKDGNVWFATYDKGVFYSNDEQFLTLSDNVKLTSETTFSIEIDARGTVWIGHNWGVDSYLPSLDVHEWFGEDEGFMGVEVNPGAMLFLPQTGLWMGTLMGVLGFNPSRLHPNPFEPTLSFESASLGKINLLGDKKRSALLNVDNDLSISFKSISLTNPRKNRYYYRLLGVHQNWKELDKPQDIEYLSLPLGKFQFELKACNSSGVCSSSPQSLAFTIIPPFYRTWWFYSLLFIIVVFAIFFMDRYRVVALLEEKSKIQEKLDIKDQEYIELDQEKQRIQNKYKMDARFLEALEKRQISKVDQASESLLHFKEHQLQISSISSKGVLTHLTKSYKVVVMVDVGVVGHAAHAIKSALRVSMEERFGDQLRPEQVLTEWKIILQSLEKIFPKYKGISWMMCLDDGKQKSCAKYGMHCFEVSESEINEIEQESQPTNLDTQSVSEEFFHLRSSKMGLVCSQSMFEQLNEGGTKTFSKQRFLDVLQTNATKPQDQLAREIFKAFNGWRGSMELFDDVAIYIWNHA